MTKRLVKVAKELNVGTTTVVDFLVSKGHEIDNKPTSKVSEEMYNMLLQEFSNSIAVKEKADKMVIGQRNQEAEEEKKSIFKPKEEAVVPPEPEEVKEEVKPEPEIIEEEVKPEPEVVVEKRKEEPEVIKAEVAKPEIKVVGKIDLDLSLIHI